MGCGGCRRDAADSILRMVSSKHTGQNPWEIARPGRGGPDIHLSPFFFFAHMQHTVSMTVILFLSFFHHIGVNIVGL